MHTALVLASRRCCSVRSSSTLPRGRRVEPNATNVDVESCSSVSARGEELDVLGVGARPSAFDELHAERVELLGDAELVLDRRGDALHLEAVAQGGVEDLDPCVVGGGGHRWSSLFGATKKPPVGRLDEHVGVHVLYEMMMMAARSVRIGVHSTGRAGQRQCVAPIPTPATGRVNWG